jgi:predicted nucleotidyltransferase
MTVAGVIAEFDPLHKGHAYLLAEIRAQLGADTAIVVAMSGSFTQRGGAAVCTPHARAEMALQAGADLILELPQPFCSSSAETFARGGAEVLRATGLVNTLCFGSECGDANLLRRIAAAIDTAVFSECIKAELDKGLPFAQARQNALENLVGADAVQTAGANDLLGIEYLRAFGADFPVCTVTRRDGGHHGAASATEVRRMMRSGAWAEADRLLPPESARIIRREREAGRCPAGLQWAERAVLYRLRTMTTADFAAIPDCGEGLENRLVQAAAQAESLEQFYMLAKSKRYAHARIRRIALRAFLGVTEFPSSVGYLRVLGASQQGLALLKQMKQTAALPVVTKPALGRELEGEAGALFIMNRRIDDLWGLCLERPLPAGASWRTTPVIIK